MLSIWWKQWVCQLCRSGYPILTCGTDLVQYGYGQCTVSFSNVCTNNVLRNRFIPEFVGRLPSITTLAPLSPKDLRRVLTDVRGSLISQYTALFGYSGVEIRFASAALDEICLKAAERGGGARALRGIMVRHSATLLGVQK